MPGAPELGGERSASCWLPLTQGYLAGYGIPGVPALLFLGALSSPAVLLEWGRRFSRSSGDQGRLPTPLGQLLPLGSIVKFEDAL